MAKLQKTATAILLTAAMLLTACANQTPAPGADINNSSEISDSTQSDSTGISNNINPTTSESENSTTDIETSSSTESESNSDSVPEESSDVNVAAVPVEFTDEDKELQKILEKLDEGLKGIDIWLTCDGPKDDQGSYLTEEYVFRILGSDDTRNYRPIPNNYTAGGLVIPHTYEGIRETMLEYFSEERANTLIKGIARKGSMTENPDGTFTVTVDGDGGLSKFIEIDETMYCLCNSVGGKGLTSSFVDIPTAKVAFQTDDTIEFIYLSGFVNQLEVNPQYLCDTRLYSENVEHGILKYERGGWKRDFDTHRPF